MRLHIAFFGLLLLTSSAYADPGWWEARGIKATAPAANHAPANIGQAKHMAAMALAELQAQLPAASHQALQADVALIVNLSLPDPLPPGYHETQRAVLLNGQLKAIAKPFYDHLRTHNATWLDNAMTASNLVVMEPGSNPLTPSPYPWSVATTDDSNRAPATLGQLKAVFSLPLETLTEISTTLDTDGDGMTDAWEIQYSLNPNDPNDANTDADNDGFSNLQESEANSNPTNASSIPGDRDGDSLADNLDAVPDDAEINWLKTPENHYVWIEQVTGASTNGGAPKHVNARGQILFEFSRPHPPLYETYPEETLDHVLWDSTSQAWIPLATSGSGNSGKVIELFGLSDQGFVFGASHTFADFQPDSPSVNSAGMIWKPSAPSPNTYLSPTHFMPDVVNRITSGVDWRGTVSNDGIANCTTFRSNATVGWETYNGSSTSPNLTYITGLGNEDRVPGAIFDTTASLMLIKSYQPDFSWSLKLYDGNQVADVEGLLPANNLGDYTPTTDINLTPSLKTNGQRRLWLTAHYYASGAYHYPVRIEKRAGGTGADRWHQPASMAEGAWKLNARGEALKFGKIWRNGTYTDLNTITSKSNTVTIIQAIDLASNGIILAQAEGNGENKIGLLFPVDLISDLNNDGQITAADNPLRDAAMASGATDEVKDKGTEFIFHNDTLSNGIWDKEDTDPAKPADVDDDDAEPILINISCLPDQTQVWLEHPATIGLKYYRDRKCTQEIPFSSSQRHIVGGSVAWPTDNKLFMRSDVDGALTYPPADPQFAGDLVLKIKIGTGQETASVKMKLTVVKQIGAKKYFHAARDYIFENNARLFVKDIKYSTSTFRICTICEELSILSPIETYHDDPTPDPERKGPRGIKQAMTTHTEMTIITNGNMVYFRGQNNKLAKWDALALLLVGAESSMTDSCQGGIVTRKHYRLNPASTEALIEGGDAGYLAKPDAKFLAQKLDGSFLFDQGHLPKNPLPIAAMGGLSTKYDHKDRADCDRQFVGYWPRTDNGAANGCLFTATHTSGNSNVTDLVDAARTSEVPAFEGTRLKLFMLDSGDAAVTLAHSNPDGILKLADFQQANILRTQASYQAGVPYFTNTYLAFKTSKPRQ